MTQKYCSRCQEIKGLADFNRDKSQPDGFTLNCRECRKAYHDRWYGSLDDHDRQGRLDRSKERRARWQSAYYVKRRDWHADYARRWVQDNIDAHRAHTREAMRRRRATAKGRLESNVSRALVRALREVKNGEPSFKLLGFTVEELMRHLERQFQDGMSWENYGDWHVDHIIPLASHDYRTPHDEGFKAAWALSNLRPLWARENVRKGARRLLLI